MKKKRENPRPEQPSSVAIVVLSAGWGWAGNWYYHVQNKHYQRSISYKSQKQAIEAALAAGFKTVKCDGKVVAKIKKEEPKEATDGQQEEVIEEGTQEADPGTPERSGV
jgi:hypothetical protein